ncbi:hypothetical protein DL98DRAFT_588688 [Cadophora sp. DSE1049]|nr:hypothetical protein DL98DRAFT_588688 [Cadophora sp. DSE1049]
MTNAAAQMSSEVSNSWDKPNNTISTTPTPGTEVSYPIATAPLSTFAKFAKLPAELQLLVWEYAAIELPARLVLVDVSFERFGSSRLTKFRSKTPLPDLLQLCRSSRQYVEKTYGYNAAIESAGGGVVRIDGKRDLLVLFQSGAEPDHEREIPKAAWEFELFQHRSKKLAIKWLSNPHFPVYKGIRKLAVYGFGPPYARFHDDKEWRAFYQGFLFEYFFTDLAGQLPDEELNSWESLFETTAESLQDQNMKRTLSRNELTWFSTGQRRASCCPYPPKALDDSTGLGCASCLNNDPAMAVDAEDKTKFRELAFRWPERIWRRRREEKSQASE